MTCGSSSLIVYISNDLLNFIYVFNCDGLFLYFIIFAFILTLHFVH